MRASRGGPDGGLGKAARGKLSIEPAIDELPAHLVPDFRDLVADVTEVADTNVAAASLPIRAKPDPSTDRGPIELATDGSNAILCEGLRTNATIRVGPKRLAVGDRVGRAGWRAGPRRAFLATDEQQGDRQDVRREREPDGRNRIPRGEACAHELRA